MKKKKAPAKKTDVEVNPKSEKSGAQGLYKANRKTIGGNANLIKPGQRLKMPDGSTHVVKKGENLSRIAAGAGKARSKGLKKAPIKMKPADGSPNGLRGMGPGGRTRPGGNPSVKPIVRPLPIFNGAPNALLPTPLRGAPGMIRPQPGRLPPGTPGKLKGLKTTVKPKK